MIFKLARLLSVVLCGSAAATSCSPAGDGSGSGPAAPSPISTSERPAVLGNAEGPSPPSAVYAMPSGDARGLTGDLVSAASVRTAPPTLDFTCHGYDEGATRAYNCIPVPEQQHHMRTFVPPVGSACDRGSVQEFPPGRIVFQIRCRDGASGQTPDNAGFHGGGFSVAGDARGLTRDMVSAASVRTAPPTLDFTCHGYDEGATRAYNCIPVPEQQHHMRTFVPPVGSACDRGSVQEFPPGRIVFQIRCRDVAGPPPPPPGRAVEFNIASCGARPSGVLYSVTINVDVRARRAVSSVNVIGDVDGQRVGSEYVGSMSQGQSRRVVLTGFVSSVRSTSKCNVRVEWRETSRARGKETGSSGIRVGR